jgi:transposase
MQELLLSWSPANVVTVIPALRTIAAISAISLVAKIDDFKRFVDPRHLMAYLGPTPSERPSGANQRRGSFR